MLASKAQEGLASRSSISSAFVEDLDPQGQVCREALAQRRRHVRHPVVGCSALPQLGPDLLGAESRLSPRDQTIGELLEAQVIDGRHDAPA